MSAIVENFAGFMRELGWMVGLGLFLIFIGLFGYALLCVAGEDDDREEDKP